VGAIYIRRFEKDSYFLLDISSAFFIEETAISRESKLSVEILIVYLFVYNLDQE
jgi:hypothetical protein